MAETYRPIGILALSAILLCWAVGQASAAPKSATDKSAEMPAKPAGKDLCATGMRQSPIDIEDTDPAGMRKLGFRYKLSLVTLSNADGGLSGTYGGGSSVYIGKDNFDLRTIAFRTPSEHRVLGRRFPAEIQFLHRSAEGRLAVVSVLVVEGRENLAFREIIERLPAGPGGSIADPKILMNARDLLPELGSYIRYSGSLTAAPCTEDVDWYVMAQPVRMSENQIARVRSAVGDNARDIQPRNGRYLLQSAMGN